MKQAHDINKIIVVGGGTAGLVSAIVLRRGNPHINIQVLESSELGIIGVGEGSTEHWREFMENVGIPLEELLQETDATFKTGIKFTNWNGDGKYYFHSVVKPWDSVFINRVPSYYTYTVANELEQETMTSAYIPHSKFVPNWNGVNQFHFDTFKLNKYLHKVANVIGITFTDAIVEKVNLDENGYVESLVDKNNNTYSADFFIDSSGFSKVIMKELGAKWIDYGKYLPMNHAIAFPTGREENINSYTESIAMDAGWRWKIPTQERHGNGYVFCDHFINTDQAIAEVEQALGHKIEVAKDIKFSAGRIDKVMIKNCVAIGLSAVFVEPLEASSIGASLQQVYLLNNLLANWRQGDYSVEKKYNSFMDSMFSNIVDFIQLHYFTKRNDTKFWREFEFEVTDFNKETLETFKHSMPSLHYFDTPFNMFRDANWIMVMYGLGMFDIDSIKRCWMNQPEYARKDIEDHFKRWKAEDTRLGLLSHREHIRIMGKF
jgi:tryptophan halogenase